MSGHPYAAVVTRFLGGLAERRRCMAAAIGDLHGPQAARAAVILRQEAHRMAGTAGSLGFPALGAAALNLEQAVDGSAPADVIQACHARVEAAAEGLQAADSTLLAAVDGMGNPDLPSA